MKLRITNDTSDRRCVADLAGRALPRKPLALCVELLAAQSEVAAQLNSGSFGDELGAGESVVVQRYGHELWRWLVDGFDSATVATLLRAPDLVIEVHGGGQLQELFWETLNSEPPPQNPHWIALGGSIEHITVSRNATSPLAPEGALMISARPYLDEDVPSGVPIEAIAEACRRRGLQPPRWLPGASLDRLSRFDTRGGRRALVHLDMHAIKAERRRGSLVSSVSPHLLLEGAAGPDPVTLSTVLDRLGGPPPRTLLLTSCDTDTTDVTGEESLQKQAFERGVDLVVIARRRLTPTEVESFSAVFHASFGAGASVATAVRDGRFALHEASRRPNADMDRVGKDAWASFILHRTEGGPDPGAPGTVSARVTDDIEPLPPLPPLLARPISGHRLALIQVADNADCRRWRGRLERWLPVLAGDAYLEEVPPGDVLPPYLEPPSCVSKARPHLKIRDPSDPTGPTLDVVLVRCDPAQLLRRSNTAGELYPLVEPWPVLESEAGAPPALRWLAGHSLSDEEIRSTGLLALTLEEGPDHEWKDLLDRMIADTDASSEDLWAGLTSCSEGLLRVEGSVPDEATGAFEALDAFLDHAHGLGLARRLQRGRFALDRLHPRLCAVIRRRLLTTADPSPSPWLDWTFRVATCAPQLRYHEGELLPYYETLADRLRRPDEVLGPQVAEVSARNYIFHALAQLAAGSTPDEVWTKLWAREAAGMPVGLDRLLEAIESKRQSGLDPADAFVDLKTTSRPRLAYLLLSNGPLPGMSVFQSDALVHTTVAAILRTEGDGDAQARIHALTEMYAWPEDRGHVWSAAATALIELGRDEEGLPMLANALGEQLVCEGPHATSHCVEALTTRAAIARKAGLRDRWHRDTELARKLIRSSNWPAFTSMVSDFLDELWTAGDHESYRTLIAFLWRTAPEKSRNAAWLARRRVQALRDVGRDCEAEEVLASVDREGLSDRTRSILDSLMISCLLARHAFDAATRLAEEVEMFATDTVLAEVCLNHAEALKGSNDGSRAQRIELLRRGAEVPDGAWAASNCRAALCHELLDAGDYVACLTEAAALRQSGGFRLAVKAAALEAATLAMLKTDRERAIAAAKVACWHRNVHIFTLLRLAFEHAGWTEDLDQVVREESVAQNEWVLNGSPLPPEEITVGPVAVAQWQLEEIQESPAPELSNVDESGVRILCESALIDWAAWEHLGYALCDQGRLNEALVYFEMGIHELERYPQVAQDERIRLSAISAHYAKTSVTRSLGQTDNAIELGTRICSRVASELREGTVSEESKSELIDQLSLAFEMVGNCQFDKGNYRASLALHGQAVRAAIRSEGPVDADAVLAAVRANPVASWRVVHCLGNWGNSLVKLGLEEQYRSARALAVLLAERLDDLESVQTNPTHKYILSLIEGSFSQHVPTDNPLGLALARVRTALASTA